MYACTFIYSKYRSSLPFCQVFSCYIPVFSALCRSALHHATGSSSTFLRSRWLVFPVEREINRKNSRFPLTIPPSTCYYSLYSHVHVYKACDGSTAKQHTGPFFW